MKETGPDRGYPARVGLVGCGNISARYLAAGYKQFEFTACADMQNERAEATAAAHGLTPMSTADLLADPSIDIVCNLTVPQAHTEVSLAAVRAGKHVYQEKPLGLDRQSAIGVLEAAAGREVRVGCAPDTFLGAGLQTCRRVVDQGMIGTPLAAVAHMANRGHEHWHPDPGFYYLRGGGPLLDMGPYYLTALVSLLGPVARVSGASPGHDSSRVVRSGPRKGQALPVEVATHTSGLLEFVSGAVATLVMSFDVWASELPRLEVHGSEGSLSLPDPNTFGGPVRLFRAGSEVWEEVPITDFDVHCRGVGLADLSEGLRTGNPHRASGSLAYHVLDVIMALTESSEQVHDVAIESDCERPSPMASNVA